MRDLDPLYNEALEIVKEEKQGSVSMLSRRLRVGWLRASNIIDQLEAMGVIGKNDGASPRKLLT